MVDREVDREVELVEAAASLVRIPVSNGHFRTLVKPPVKGLNSFADQRAQTKGVGVAEAVIEEGDKEALEELADCRSYLVWKILHDPGISSASNELRAMAIGHVAAAFHLIELASEDEL